MIGTPCEVPEPRKTKKKDMQQLAGRDGKLKIENSISLEKPAGRRDDGRGHELSARVNPGEADEGRRPMAAHVARGPGRSSVLRVCLRLHAIVDHLRGFRVRGRLRRRAVAVGRGPAALAADALQPAENVRARFAPARNGRGARAPATGGGPGIVPHDRGLVRPDTHRPAASSPAGNADERVGAPGRLSPRGGEGGAGAGLRSAGRVDAGRVGSGAGA